MIFRSDSFKSFYIDSPLYILTPNLLSYDNSTITNDLTRSLNQVRITLKIDRKSNFNCSTEFKFTFTLTWIKKEPEIFSRIHTNQGKGKGTVSLVPSYLYHEESRIITSVLLL